MRKSYLWILFLGVFLLWSRVGVATDIIQPYVSASITQDSNLFRFSKDRVSDDASDTISRIEAGVGVDYPISRQRLNLRASINRNQFQRYEFLDYDGNDGQAVWNWQVGNLWQGDLGYTRSQTLASFAETQATVRDVRTQQSAFADAIYKLHPDWRLHWGGRWYALESSRNQFINSDETSGVLGVDYISNANNSVGVQGQFLEASFPGQTTLTSRFDNGFSQTTISSVADWSYSVSSRFQGRLGYTQRRYNQLVTRDFNGMTRRLTYNWSVTGKTLLSVAAWREVGAVGDVINTFAVIKGSSLDLSWFPTRKIFIRGGIVYRSQDFRGDSGFALGVDGKREDEMRTVSASLGYSPLQNIQLSLDGVVEQRDSTRIFIDYNYKLIMANIKVSF